jgi:hypothetical protein
MHACMHVLSRTSSANSHVRKALQFPFLSAGSAVIRLGRGDLQPHDYPCSARFTQIFFDPFSLMGKNRSTKPVY